MISSYEAAVLYMEKARNKSKGRPMKGTGWRLFQDGNEYVVYVHGEQVGRFLPDNTFMFALTGERAFRVAATLSSSIHRNLPFVWMRAKHRTYRVGHTNDVRPEQRWRHVSPPPKMPIVYDGLKFDLFTGKCVNPMPDAAFKPVVNPERRRVWVAASRAWKCKLKAAARVGVFDSLIAQEKQNPTPWRSKPKWRRPKQLDILYKAIKTGDCSVDLLRMFVASETGLYKTTTSMQVYERIEAIVRAQSVELRKRFGVFDGE